MPYHHHHLGQGSALLHCAWFPHILTFLPGGLLPRGRAGHLDSKATPPSLRVQAGPQGAVLNLRPARPGLPSVLQQLAEALHKSAP